MLWIVGFQIRKLLSPDGEPIAWQAHGGMYVTDSSKRASTSLQ